MTVVKIEHTVPNFEKWKEAFDRDPADRKGAGVRHYQVFRQYDDPNHVFIDLAFDSMKQAKAFLDKIQRLWDGPAKSLALGARACVAEPFDSVSFAVKAT